MKYVAAIVFAIFMMSATSTLFENPGFNIDETINGLFPKSFFIKGILKVNTEDIRDDIFRFDGNNNLLSISQTLYDTDFKMNLTFTLAFDFVNNMTTPTLLNTTIVLKIMNKWYFQIISSI